MRLLRSTLLVVVAAIVSCALGAAPALAKTVVVDAVDAPATAFQPANTTIDVGDTVRFEFDAATTTHTVTSSSANWTIDETRDPNGAPIATHVRHRRRLHVPVQGPQRHDRLDHGPGRGPEHARQGPRLLQDRRPSGMTRSRRASRRSRRSARPTASRSTPPRTARSSRTPTSRSTTSSSSSRPPATSSTPRSRPRSSTTSSRARATSASTPPPTPSTRGRGTARCSAATSATTRPARRRRPSTSRTRTSPRPPVYRTRGCAMTSGTTSSRPTNPVVNGNQPGIVDWSPREAGVHVLATVDESTYDETDDSAAADDHPVAWCTNYDGGRAWYTAMGHTQSSFSEPEFRAHILGGLRTAAGTVTADCGKQRTAPPAAERLRDHDARRRHREPDGARRRQGRAHVLRRAHHGRGQRHQGRRLGRHRGHRSRSRASRRTACLGITLDRELRDQPQPLHVATRRCRTPRRRCASRASRSTATCSTWRRSAMLFTFSMQRAECCHSSRLAGDAAPTATSTSASATTPTRSPPTASTRSTSARAARFWDAQRTSANTNSYSGKILRITPLANPTGPGVGTGYTIPSGNLFHEAEDTTNKTLPEIYAMGFRNPFRITIDPQDGQGADGRLRP